MAEETQQTQETQTETTETASTAETQTTTETTQPKWPTDWRKEFAAGDEKAVQRLERFAAPPDIFKSYRALEQRISSGELRAAVPFPEKGTDEQKAAWRSEQGLPEAPDKYKLDLPAGFVIGEADQPIVKDFLQSAYDSNMPPQAVNRAVNWFFQNRDKQLAQIKEAEAEAQKGTEDALRIEWGNDYRKHDAVLDGFLAETVSDEKMRADLGKARRQNPEFAKWMLGVALQLNPAGTVLPGSGIHATQGIADELANLKKMMGDRSSEYWRGNAAEKHQSRYRELLSAQARLERKSA